MNENEWLLGVAPKEMRNHCYSFGNLRKHRLVYCGMCRLIWHLLDHPASRESVEKSELYADGLIGAKELDSARRASLPTKLAHDHDSAAMAASVVSRSDRFHEAMRFSGVALQNTLLETGKSVAEATAIQHKIHCDIFRDVFGNPFRPVELDPRWLTANVVDLSRAIYDNRAFDRMPILADALMDAGCDRDDILAHCRHELPHVLGCWVVDLIIGKKR